MEGASSSGRAVDGDQVQRLVRSSSPSPLHTPSSSSSSELVDDVPAFLDPFQSQSQSRRVSIADVESNSNSIVMDGYSYTFTQSTPPPHSSSARNSLSAPGTPTATRRSSSTGNRQFLFSRNSSYSSASFQQQHQHGQQQQVDSREYSLFVEDLPEFRPYSLFGVTSPHRRRFRSSPTASFILRRRSNVTTNSNSNGNTPPPPRTPTPRSISGNSDGFTHQAASPSSYHPISHTFDSRPHNTKKKQRWKQLLFASAVLSIASGAVGHASRDRSDYHQNDQPEMVHIHHNHAGPSQPTSHLRFTTPPHAAIDASLSDTALTRRPSKLKKRPPKTLSHTSPSASALHSRRGSTYNDWRKSMMMEVSADVSRRSSQRSRKSTSSRGTRSMSTRTNASSSKRPFIGSEKGNIGRGRGRKRSPVFLRCCRKLLEMFRCRGG